MDDQKFFTDEIGNPIPCITYGEYQKILNSLVNDYGVSYTQIVESASFSFAMIVRAALAYSAMDAYSVGIIDDNLSSWIVCGTLRHLVNAGAKASLIYIKPSGEVSPELKSQLNTLQKMDIEINEVTDALPDLSQYLEDAHNVLCGLSSLSHQPTDIESTLITSLNELKTPIHCVQAPIGLDPDSGGHHIPTLYASSTLSLGLPLQGLFLGNEYCGRNYICDISLTKKHYASFDEDLGLIFASQPVIRITLPKTEKAD